MRPTCIPNTLAALRFRRSRSSRYFYFRIDAFQIFQHDLGKFQIVNGIEKFIEIEWSNFLNR